VLLSTTLSLAAFHPALTLQTLEALLKTVDLYTSNPSLVRARAHLRRSVCVLFSPWSLCFAF
jgi:hypothetical protein